MTRETIPLLWWKTGYFYVHTYKGYLLCLRDKKRLVFKQISKVFVDLIQEEPRQDLDGGESS